MSEMKSLSMSEGTGKDKKEKTVEVRKIANGYILRERVEYTDPKKGWCCDTTETYYEENPLKGIKLPK